MFNSKTFKFKKIKQSLTKLPKIINGKAFLTFLILLFISLIFGALVFYQYSILAKKIVPEITDKSLKFKENTYQIILEEWQKRDEESLKTDVKEYLNIFGTSTEKLTK